MYKLYQSLKFLKSSVNTVLSKIGFKQWQNSLKVAQKISLGYFVATGTAVIGITVGIAISEIYQKFADHEREHMQQEVEMLTALQVNMLQSRSHEQKLIYLITQPAKFRQEHIHLNQHLAIVNQKWHELQLSLSQDHRDNEMHTHAYPRFLQTYKGVIEQYTQSLETLLQQIETSHQTPTAIIQHRNLLVHFTNSNVAIKFEQLSDELQVLINDSHQEYAIALKSVENSHIIRFLIIAASMVFSLAIASILAKYNSHTITRPLEAISRVAQLSAWEKNFDLQASVTTNDELRFLANSLNELIKTVKELLQKQETKNEYLQQKLLELKQTQAQLIQSEKMSSLGQVVAGLAHEINNPVNFIYGNLKYTKEYTNDLLELLQIYQKYYPQPPLEIQTRFEEIELPFLTQDLSKILQSMEVGTERIQKIILALRNFSRLDEAELKTVDIHEGIESTLMIIQSRLQETSQRPAIEVIQKYNPLPLVECYPSQLNQVLMNLLNNAIDALEEKAINNQLDIQDHHHYTIHIHTNRIDTNWVEIRIIDNGCGINPDNIQKLFDPFFTTKAVGKGTGLGLSIGYQIITEQHRGKLNCSSVPGVGAEFIIQIPIQQILSS